MTIFHGALRAAPPGSANPERHSRRRHHADGGELRNITMPPNASAHTAQMRRLSSLLLAGLCAMAIPAFAQTRQDAPAAIATLRVEAVDGGYLAWADNRLPGPIEVRLESTDGPLEGSQPALPARASVPALGSVVVARLPMTRHGAGLARLRLLGTPGSSNARPQEALYLLPVAQGTARLEQGFEGSFSHQGPENRYALDFAVPEGTPVLAARAGRVLQVEDGFDGHGLNYARDGGRANFIRILHADGSMALYAHLQAHGARVRPGQQVEAGQAIGLSGNTGYSTAPHLHFVVQVNRSLQLLSIPFRLASDPTP